MNVFDTSGGTPPECGWGPLLAWLKRHDIEPRRCFRFRWDAGVLEADLYVTDGRGGYVFDEDDDIKTETVVRRYSEPPPIGER